MLLAIMWMGLDNIILNEVSQRESNTYLMISLISGMNISKYTNRKSQGQGLGLGLEMGFIDVRGNLETVVKGH